MAEREYINTLEFAKRCTVPPAKVRKALDQDIIQAAVRKQGGTFIDWETWRKPFLKWCPEGKLCAKKSWTTGKMLDIPDEAVEEEPEEEDRITEDMSLEDLERLLKSKCSTDEAKRIRQILAGLKEVAAMREANGKFVDIDQFLPKFAQLGTLLRKTMQSIRPRVASQFAAMTDPFAIGRLLDKEIELVLNQFQRFITQLGGTK